MQLDVEKIPPVSFLAELREEVLNHSLKRMPKWKFRLAPDLIMQLQPKPTVMPSALAITHGFKPQLQRFEGVAVMSENIKGDALKRLPQGSCPPWWQIKFELYANEPDADWIFHRTGGCWQWGADRNRWPTLTQRIVAAFRAGLFSTGMPVQMLSHNCVICGKGLTDPASMARWIGPECASTSTLRVPFTIAATSNTGATMAPQQKLFAHQ
jgi:hypothetical protein